MTTEIPIIDLGRPLSEAAPEVAAAVEQIGFFIVTGHGVPTEVIAETESQSRAFFDLPLEQKLASRNAARTVNRGYTPFGSEANGGAAGRPAPADLRQGFAYGRPTIPTDPYFTAPEAGSLFEPNVWPSGPPGFREALQNYYTALEALNGRLLGIFAAALGLAPDFFNDKYDRQPSTVRLIDYPEPEREPTEGEFRCGAHTDFGSHTMLLVDDAPGGLQVKTREGDWIDVRAPAGSFVINVGDLMMMWTNDRWLSNQHRVVNPPSEAHGKSRRQSIAYFVYPNYDAEIACIESCLRPGDAPRHPPTTPARHRARQFGRVSVTTPP